MYSTCLFCHRSLGNNEAIEHFPVGRRLAFDAAKGRLWVICRGCARWNLTPLEERWEAIEECERAYRDTRLRAATEQIGLARLREGTELVRIGQPLRPEFAAWRYGDQFGRRRRRHLVTMGAMTVAGGLVFSGAVGALAIPGGFLTLQAFNAWNLYRVRLRTAARIRDEYGVLRDVRAHEVHYARVVRGPRGQWTLTVPHRDGVASLEGEAAVRAAAHILPILNGAGGAPRQVRAAVGQLEQFHSAAALFFSVAREDTRPRSFRWWQYDSGVGGLPLAKSLHTVDFTTRLALEMAIHEESERRALEGELAALAEEWREAERIAKIADELLLPASVEERARRLKGRRPPDAGP